MVVPKEEIIVLPKIRVAGTPKEASGGESKSAPLSGSRGWCQVNTVTSRIRGEEDLRNHLVQSTLPRKEIETLERTKPNFLTFRSLRSAFDNQLWEKEALC